MKKYFFGFVLVLMMIGLFTITSFAAIPHLLNYQGRLTDRNNLPLEGSYSLTFRIYDAETSGNLLWEETQSAVVIQKGIFSILLGSINNLNLAFDKPYYLEIKVGDEVMSPRQAITAAGYAFKAETAGTAGNAVKAETANKTIAIEALTTDPTNLTAGQIWFRTDLKKIRIYTGSDILNIAPEPVDCIQLASTTHSYSGGGIGANSIDGNFDTAQSASAQGNNGGHGVALYSTHNFSSRVTLTSVKYKMYTRAWAHGNYVRDYNTSMRVEYSTDNGNTWVVLSGSSLSASGGDGERELSKDDTWLGKLVGVTNIRVYAQAFGNASGNEGNAGGTASIYEIQAFGL